VVIAAVAFAVLWFLLFLFASLVDEDVNHWNWPSGGGPGVLATIRMATLTGVVSAGVVGAAWWALTRR
jgi:hypothetical protein